MKFIKDKLCSFFIIIIGYYIDKLLNMNRYAVYSFWTLLFMTHLTIPFRIQFYLWVTSQPLLKTEPPLIASHQKVPTDRQYSRVIVILIIIYKLARKIN